MASELAQSEDPAPEANHFDRIQPKDSLELIRSQSVSYIGSGFFNGYWYTLRWGTDKLVVLEYLEHNYGLAY